MNRAGENAPALAVVLVHYHAPQSVAEAIAALARDLQSSAISAEWRIVDNGSSVTELAALRSLGLPIVPGAGNRGFAAGVNAGFAATTAPCVLVLNPDVMVLPGCARGLLVEIASGASAAAPRLYWDPERRFLLPVGEERTRTWEVLALLAKRWPRLAARARRRWRADARRHWLATGALASNRLSGAALAIAREAWSRVGPFDESFRLYFEETDWLLRLEAAGLVARQAAAAEAVHGFAHSTKEEPQAAEWFDQSARLFRDRRYGRGFTRVHDRLSRAVASDPAGSPRSLPLPRLTETTLAGALDVAGDDVVWLELSPNREGFPAAGPRVPGRDLGAWQPPLPLMAASGIAGMSLCAVEGSGRELGRWWIDQKRSLSPIVR
jgi:GT2 family glycosyltransferase